MSTPPPTHVIPTPSAGEKLRSFVERVERLQEEKDVLAADMKEVYAEAKANGFDVKTLRKVVALRKLDATERREQEAILHTYMHALGMRVDFSPQQEQVPTSDEDEG